MAGFGTQGHQCCIPLRNIQRRKSYLAVTWMNSSARPNPASTETDAAPEKVPKCGQKATTANVRSTVSTDCPVSVRQSLFSQSLTLIMPWHPPCSLDRVVRKLEIQSAQIHRLRERKEQEGANHERDFSKTD